VTEAKISSPVGWGNFLRLLAATMIEYSGHGEDMMASIRTIAADAHIGKTTAQRYLDAGVSLRMLQQTRPPGKRSSAAYAIADWDWDGDQPRAAHTETSRSRYHRTQVISGKAPRRPPQRSIPTATRTGSTAGGPRCRISGCRSRTSPPTPPRWGLTTVPAGPRDAAGRGRAGGEGGRPRPPAERDRRPYLNLNLVLDLDTEPSSGPLPGICDLILDLHLQVTVTPEATSTGSGGPGGPAFPLGMTFPT
jgi:hypothetical protein